MSVASRLLVASMLALGCASGDEDESRVSFGSIGPGSGPSDATSTGGSTEGATAGSMEGPSDGSTSSEVMSTGAVDGTTGPDDGVEGSTGASPPSTYPPCVGGACEVGTCIEVEDGAVCGASCTDATMCPLSGDSEALPECVAFEAGMTSCALDCAGGEACPAGMLCDLTIGLGAFCVWP